MTATARPPGTDRLAGGLARRRRRRPGAWTIELTDDQRDELASVARAAAADGSHHRHRHPRRRAAALARDVLGRGRATPRRRPRLRAPAPVPGRPARRRGGRARVLRPRPAPRHPRQPGRRRHPPRPRPRRAGRTDRARGPPLPHPRAPGLPHRRRRHHRPALPARPASGGESKLASSYAVYNEILRRRPDLLEVLYEPMWWDRNGEESPGEDPAFPLPVLHDVDGGPRSSTSAGTSATPNATPRSPGSPTAQREALDLIESDRQRPRLPRRDGLPARRRPAAQQRQDPPLPRGLRGPRRRSTQRRHLLRLWLSAHDFASVESQLRAGIPTRQP